MYDSKDDPMLNNVNLCHNKTGAHDLKLTKRIFLKIFNCNILLKDIHLENRETRDQLFIKMHSILNLSYQVAASVNIISLKAFAHLFP